MKKHLHLFFLLSALLLAASSFAQIKISGKVIDNKDKPVKGANVYLNNTIDGATTDSNGYFSFTTTETGAQTLVASELAHENMGLPLILKHDTSGIVLRMTVPIVRDLDAVVITAGSFDASNDKSKTVLKPLDIVTTAGANADVVKAIQTLPGTQQPGTENGLFVRGGDASEAAIIVDGMTVQSAFVNGPPGLATRSRFGAFSYQGVAFSSGGYSARYGQALSGILELNTVDISEKSTVNLGLNMGGVYASGTKRWKKSSLDFGGSYSNLTPYFKLASTNFNFYDVPVGYSANVRYVYTPNKNGILKLSANTNYTHSGIGIPNPSASDSNTNGAYNPFRGQGDTVNYETTDKYYYTSFSYKQLIKGKYSLYTAGSFAYNNNSNMFGKVPFIKNEHRAQYRLEGRDFITSRINLLVGTEIQNFGTSQEFDDSLKQEFTENQIAAYAEMEWIPIYWLAVKPGIRYEHSALLNVDKIAPRIAAAVRTGKHSQVSLAGGIFYQDAGVNYLLAGKRPDMMKAVHFITNWQWSRNDRTLRIEGYHKNYQDLIRELYPVNSLFISNRFRQISWVTPVANSGYGFAQGLELFYRDKKSIKNADYWVSYSYINTKRFYENYPYLQNPFQAFSGTPTFIADHNLNLVGKYFVDKWQTNFSATYTFASGFPYFNPEQPLTQNTFLADRTPAVHNVALAIAYLHSFGKWFTVFYLSMDNVLNTRNIYGYRYSYDSNNNVIPGSKTGIVPGSYRTIFVGVNCSLTKFKKDEL